MTSLVASIPSPESGVWHIGPLPLRAYALGIIIGALLALWIGEKRFVARGGRSGLIGDVAIWAVPFGIVGARIYHVLTDPELYFGEGRDAIDALYIWEGGLGIWGAISGGALGAWIACRRYDVSFASVADALAPGLLVAQAVGRLGNYFNQELFGKPTDRPWGLEIDAVHRPPGYEQFATFHPTFLYEMLWNLAAAASAHRDRPPAQAHRRPGVRALRDALHRRSRLDRDAAHRHGQPPRPVPAQRLDVDHPVRAGHGVLRSHQATLPSG